MKTAVGSFGKFQDKKAEGCVWGDTAAKSNTALVKSKYEGCNNIISEEYLEKQQELYKQCVETSSKKTQATIITGLNLAYDLRKARRVIESGRLLKQLDTSE